MNSAGGEIEGCLQYGASPRCGEDPLGLRNVILETERVVNFQVYQELHSFIGTKIDDFHDRQK